MEIDFENLHHAYLLVGHADAAEASLHAFFESQGVRLTGSPDFFVSKTAVFGVDEARELNAQATRKAFGSRKIFFILPERLTHEAQNALLKTFEDPYPNTHFFLVLREEELALPTLRSRMQTIRLESKTPGLSDAKKFLSLSLKDRLNFVKKFIEAEKSAPAFLDELLLFFKTQGETKEKIREVYDAKLLSDDRGAAPRLILEHLALVL